MPNFLTDALSAVSGAEWDEVPVDIETFVTSPDFLNFPPLSENQYLAIKNGTQIYRLETLIALYGPDKGWKRWNETCNEVLLQWGKGNISGDQRVWSPEFGYCRADELVEEGWMADARIQEQFAYPFYEEGEDDIFRITTTRGYQIECGINHSFPVWKNDSNKTLGQIIKQESQELPLLVIKKGDILEIKKGWSEPHKPYDITPQVARLIGYMVGDGTWVRKTSHGYRNPMFTNATPEVQEDIVSIVESLGGTVVYTLSGMGCWQIRINGLTPLFVQLGLVQEYNTQKQWNNDWLSMSRECTAEFLRGVWATDGWVHRQGPRSAVAAVEMTSEPCIAGIHLMLLKFGYAARIYANRPLLGNDKHKPTYRVKIGSAGRVKEFIADIGGIPGKNTDWLKQIPVKKINDHVDRIRSIEYIGRKPSYGTMVEVESVFNAGGIITLNSGKDMCSVIMCCYIVYLLLCLKDPAKYYGKPSGDNIDIMNIAVNAQQANRVFFKNLLLRVQQCPWFYGKYHPTQGEINFDKNVNVISGHSESESLEGYNVIVVVLDEISGFAQESASGNSRAKTGQYIYDMHRGAVDSRFDEFGKVILLSFPRFDGDFISAKYNDVVAEKNVVVKTHIFKIEEDLPDGLDTNELYIEWPEDNIIRYTQPNYYAQRRATWEVNPTKTIDGFKRAFFANKADALGRFACVPGTSLQDAFIKNPQVVDEVFTKGNGVDQVGAFNINFTPKLDKEYYVHVDLSKVHDRCAVGLAHVEKWVMYEHGIANELQPVVQVDALRYWEPSKDNPMDYKEVTDYIFALRRRGFVIKLVTFDRWQANDTMNFLERQGIKTDTLSVGNNHYDDFLMLLYDEGRLSGPKDEKLIKELKELRYIKGKIDHPRSGYKDLSDATCGAIFNAVKHTMRPQNREVEIVSLQSIRKKLAEERAQSSPKDGVIRPPKNLMPDDMRQDLERVSSHRLEINNIKIL